MSTVTVAAAPSVTREQAEMFADEWFEESYNTGMVLDACRLTGVTEGLAPEEQTRIEKAICWRVSELAKAAIVEAFVTAAGDVLAPR